MSFSQRLLMKALGFAVFMAVIGIIGQKLGLI